MRCCPKQSEPRDKRYFVLATSRPRSKRAATKAGIGGPGVADSTDEMTTKERRQPGTVWASTEPLTSRREHYVDFLRALSLLVVVVFHWGFTILVFEVFPGHISQLGSFHAPSLPNRLTNFVLTHNL